MARLTPKLVLTLDKYVGELITNYRNQSKWNFPNIKVFNKGVSTSSKLRSDQHIACVLIIYLVISKTDFESLVIYKNNRKEREYLERTRIFL